MKNRANHYDAIIIGGGVGGLTVALGLSKMGKKVILFEKNKKIGGNCTSWKLGDYTFDTAVHQLTGMSHHGTCGNILKDLGIFDKLSFKAIDPFLNVVFPDKEYCIPNTIEKQERLFSEYFPSERKSIHRILIKLSNTKKDLYIVQKMLYDKNPSIDRMVKNYVSFNKKLTFPFTIIPLYLDLFKNGESIFRRYIKNDKLYSMLTASWPYIGVPPKYASGLMLSTLFISQALEQTYYPIGSSQKIADVFVEAIKEFGGEIREATPVRKILIDENEAQGIVSDNGTASGKAIICNAPAYYVFSELVDPKYLSNGFLHSLQNIETSIGPFKVYLGLDYNIANSGLENHEYLFYESYDHEKIYENFKNAKIDMLSAYSPTKADPSLAPKGHSTLILTTMLPWKTNPDWRSHKNEIKERM
ncbi:MAG: NAD(P)/FAD-dependent oxidoreductase, partial [Chitinispirillia bacterium]